MSPAQESAVAAKPRTPRPGLDAVHQALLEQLDDLRDGVLTEIKAARQDTKAAGDRLISLVKWGLGLFAFGGVVWITTVAGLLYYTLSLFGESRGVDTSRAATSASTVITATSDAVHTVTEGVDTPDTD